MAQKLAFTLLEVANEIGVSTKTVQRKLFKYKEMLIMPEMAKRKRFYNPTEVEFIKTLFHNEVSGL